MVDTHHIKKGKQRHQKGFSNPKPFPAGFFDEDNIAAENSIYARSKNISIYI